MKIICYKNLISFENLKIAGKRVKDNILLDLDYKIREQITKKRLRKLHDELVSQKYKPKPSRQFAMTNSDGSVQYLVIGSSMDKIVQGALLNKLEPILEKKFLDVSYGFRPKRGCHNVFKEIKYK